MQNCQLLPYGRSAELIEDVFQHKLSTGTLYNTQKHAFKQLATFEKELKALLILAPVVGFDETGFRVWTKCWWLHSCSTQEHTYYEVHQKRGNAAMDRIGILPDFEGIAIHVFWKRYLKYECTHGFCNAHFSTMSGYLGYHAIGDFIKKHKWDFIKLFKPQKDRIPSFSTVRRVLNKLAPSDFQDIYQDWLASVQKISQPSGSDSIDNWHPIDEQCIHFLQLISLM